MCTKQCDSSTGAIDGPLIGELLKVTIVVVPKGSKLEPPVSHKYFPLTVMLVDKILSIVNFLYRLVKVSCLSESVNILLSSCKFQSKGPVNGERDIIHCTTSLIV